MNSKLSLTILALSIAVAAVGCGDSTPDSGPNSKAALAEAAKNTYVAEKLPSIYEHKEHQAAAQAMETALQAFLKVAKESDDVAALTPVAQEFEAKKSALLGAIPDQLMRQSAFKDVMQKTLSSLEDREAFAAGMTTYHRARAAARAGQSASTPATNK